MSINQVTRGQASVGRLLASEISVGGRDAVTKLAVTGVSVNPASIAAGVASDVTVTVTGAEVGDFVIARPPATLEAGLDLQLARVSATNTVILRLVNRTAGAVDGAALSWDFLLIR